MHSPVDKATHRHAYVVWALNDKVKRWLPIVGGLSHEAGVDEIRTRQARLRADGRFESRFKLLPEGKEP